MADNPNIKVSSNAGIIDTLTAAGRYLVVIIGAVPILLGLLGKHDFSGLVAYFQGSDGAQLVAAVGALVALAYGLFKTFRRGDQMASVAANPAVPDRVASLK